MKLSAPKNITWIVAVVLGVVGFIGHFVVLPVIGAYTFWFLFLGFAILAVANYFKGI